ncbi:MAG: hypothetical protein ABII09_07235 [Planctomycetota bacterium]
MLKRKAGLQKEVSKIFTGIQIPRRNAPEADTPPAAPAAAPAKYIVPKPIPVASHPLTIPQPKKNTPPAPASAPKVYEPQASARNVYEPRAAQQAPYVPPAPARFPARQPRQELPPKRPMQRPVLKIWEKLKGKLLAAKPGVRVNPGRQKVMIVVMPILLIVFIVVLTRVLRSPSRSSVKNANNSAALSNIPFDGKIDWQLPPLYPENLRDPMVFGSITQSKENADRPMVKGIVYSEDNPCAVVGDRIVSAGDVVQGATVVKVNSDSVEFAKGDETWTQKVER